MTREAQQICETILNSPNQLTHLAGEMIAVPSPTGQEGPMAEWLAQWLNANQFQVETFDLDPETMAARYPGVFFPWSFPYTDRPNVVGRLPGKGGGRSLMINFHMDVVDAAADAWETDPWTATVKGGMLTGRGAADMKGGAAAALFAAKSIIDAGIPLKGDLIIAGVIEEEGPGNGTLALQARGIQADACIIPEPTDLTAAVGVAGGVYGFVSIKGKTSHSTTPWNGVNALDKAAVVQKGLQSWQEMRQKAPLHPLMAHAPGAMAAAGMVSVNRTDDGAVGTVPASVNVMVRATVLPGENPEAVTQGIEEHILSQALKDDWLAEHRPEFSWVPVGARNHSAELAMDHPLGRELDAAFTQITGRAVARTCLVSPADMQQLMTQAPVTPTLMFGPGSLEQAHTTNESLPVDELVTASAVLARFIMDWCNGDPL
ncbi:MAG: ArgE/DapE family deacylase [Desulfobacterales bacterium]|nr:ArgE/DapE family deacylase [Desulfobacterales bacterium]